MTMTTPNAVVDALRTQVDALAAELGRLAPQVILALGQEVRDLRARLALAEQRAELAEANYATLKSSMRVHQQEYDELEARLRLAERALEDHDQLKDAAQDAFVVLQALALSVKWELAQEVMTEVTSAADLLHAALARFTAAHA